MRLVVFDIDGTLVDSQVMILAAMARAFEAHGLACPSRAETLAIVGLSLPEAFQRLAPDGPVAGLADAYKAAFRDLRADPDHHEPLFDGMGAIVRTLSRQDDTVLGIATGKSRRGVDAVLARHELDGAFLTIQTADEHPSKPHPSMLRRAMTETGIDADRTAFIGDTAFDMEMARAVGAAGIGVGWGYHAADALVAAGARTVVATSASLLGVLDEALPREAAMEGA